MTPQQLWAEAGHILREQGFDDIEPMANGLLVEHQRLTDKRIADHEALAAYYAAAGDFLATHRFASPLQQRIWQLHVTGKSGKAIRRQLRRERGKGAQRYIDETIRKLRKKMLSRRKRGRRPRPGGCYVGCDIRTLRLQDGVSEALDYLVQRWQLPWQEVVRRLVLEAARVS